ncbi:hypothetical protein Y032_0014g2457 [Ancylostoma ceylanicum]|uniref:Uncharacterized protein n=1 Tax=Ancylostoma ceylanicum TaxID=53326 RepID=A0A016VAP8_9BILA|nr:hypothetical protein Y032_0014g2457 [Ancylostoma ceylanicum]
MCRKGEESELERVGRKRACNNLLKLEGKCELFKVGYTLSTYGVRVSLHDRFILMNWRIAESRRIGQSVGFLKHLYDFYS